ncbi:MAG: SurA N-terminal domain-containing protein [Desulfobacterales bacterium]|nr:SurA N-terminal domain-containing protein [Desulfobacterales bacterium]
MILDLVTVISDETVLLAAAAEKGLAVDDREVDLAEAEFKKEYPEDSFEQMLLENAIPYRVWKRRLKKDLILQSVLKEQLIDNQEITPDDMIAFYNQYRKHAGNGKTTDIDESSLVEMLRLEKSQAAYDNWIASLKTVYPVTIDQTALAGFLVNQVIASPNTQKSNATNRIATKQDTPNQD